MPHKTNLKQLSESKLKHNDGESDLSESSMTNDESKQYFFYGCL